MLLKLKNKKLQWTVMILACTATSAFWASAASSRGSSGGMYTVYYVDQSTGKLLTTQLDSDSLHRLNVVTLNANGQTLYFYGSGNTAEQARFAYLTQNPELMLSYQARERAPVARCLANPNVPEGASKFVSYEMHELCDSSAAQPDMVSDVNYTVSKRNGQLGVDVGVILKYQGDEANHAAAIDRMREVRDCVKTFFARNGLKLNLNLYQGDAPRAGYTFVTLHDYKDKLKSQLDDAGNWDAFGLSTHPLTAGQVCAVIAHEVGHLVGLPDRYQAAACPSRPDKGGSNDIMAVIPYTMDYSMIYNDQDLAKIISPLCEGKESQDLGPAIPSYHYAPTSYGSTQTSSITGTPDSSASSETSSDSSDITGEDISKAASSVWDWFKRQAQ